MWECDKTFKTTKIKLLTHAKTKNAFYIYVDCQTTTTSSMVTKENWIRVKLAGTCSNKFKLNQIGV